MHRLAIQKNLICTPQVMTAERSLAVQNGGSRASRSS